MPSMFRRFIATATAAAALSLLMAGAGPVAAQLIVIGGTNSGRVEGSGRVVEDARSVAAFSGLVVDGPIDVRLRAAAADRVIVHADDNIAPLIETRVTDGKLVVGLAPKASYRTRSATYVVVEFRELSSLQLRGSGDVRADRIRAPIFEATLRGSGDVQIDTLETEALALSISGSGDFSARGHAAKVGVVVVGSGDVSVDKLESREVAVRIRGSGDVRVHATDTLQVDIAGSGDVRYRGEPRLSKKIAGTGELLPLR
jgi:hypothetical protein